MNKLTRSKYQITSRTMNLNIKMHEIFKETQGLSNLQPDIGITSYQFKIRLNFVDKFQIAIENYSKFQHKNSNQLAKNSISGQTLKILTFKNASFRRNKSKQVRNFQIKFQTYVQVPNHDKDLPRPSKYRSEFVYTKC